MSSKIIDHLTEDIPIPGQQFVCLSFVVPEGKVKNCSMSALKIRGVFSNIEDANQHAENLRSIDPDFDIYVGEVGKWLPLNPDPNTIADERYKEKELNHIISNYKKGRDESKTIFDERKNEMMKKIAIEEQEKQKTVKKRLQKKLEQRKGGAGSGQNDAPPSGLLGPNVGGVSDMMDRINNRIAQLDNEKRAELQSHSENDSASVNASASA